MEPTSSWLLVGFLSTAPRRELQASLFIFKRWRPDPLMCYRDHKACPKGRGVDGELGSVRCKLSLLGWMGCEVLLYNTGSSIQSLGIEHDGREHKKGNTHRHTQTHIHTHTHTTHIHTDTHTHHTHTHIHTHTQTHKHIHTHIYIQTHINTHTYTQTHMHRHIYTQTHIHTCTHTHRHIHTYTHTHIQTHTHMNGSLLYSRNWHSIVS